MEKVRFAVCFVVAVLGAVLLLISQVPLTREYYEVVDTRSFSSGELWTFYSTFEANGRYRFEAIGVNWMSSPRTPRYDYSLSVGNDTILWGPVPLFDPPSEWNYNQPVTCAYNVTFWHTDENGSRTIARAATSASVEISQFQKTTYRLTYLVYVALPLLIIGAILMTITAKDVDSRMRT